jgi:fluoride exporter
VTAPIDPDAPGDPGPPGPSVLLSVGVGGVLGTLVRYGIVRAIPTSAGSIPWSIFLVNVVGSLALGFVLQLVLERWPTDRYLRPFVAVGFIGAFTTFSTVMVDADLLVRDGDAATAAVYVVLSVVVGLVASFSGIAVARRIGRAGAPSC